MDSKEYQLCFEEEYLSPLAARSARSRGRARP